MHKIYFMLLHNKLLDKNIILASGSPRRRELMAQADLKFTVADKYEIDEIFPASMPAHEVPLFLAMQKSQAYPIPLAKDDILITADTVVIVDNEVIGKPTDRLDAIEMIGRISGTMHEVVTGVVIRTATQTIEFDSLSRVWLRELSAEEIEYYVDTYSPMDKAGAYGIQEWIGCTAIERIEGSFYNVMGLPVQMLYQKLKLLSL